MSSLKVFILFALAFAFASAVPIQQSQASGIASVSVNQDLPADFRLYGLARLPAVDSFDLGGSNFEAPVGITWRASNVGNASVTFAVTFKDGVCIDNDQFNFLIVNLDGTRSVIPGSGSGCSVNVAITDQDALDSDDSADKIRGRVYLFRPFGFSTSPTSTTTTSTSTTRTSTSTSTTRTSTTRTSTSTTRTSTSTTRTSTSTSTTRTSTSTTTRTSTSTSTSTTRTSTSTSTTRTSTSTTRTSTSTTRTSTSTTRTASSTTNVVVSSTTRIQTSTSFVPTSTTFFRSTTTAVVITTPSPQEIDRQYLNYLLNLKYLQAEFNNAAIGRSLSYANSVNSTVYGGNTVNFTSSDLNQIASEIANDQDNQVSFLRSYIGSGAVNRPNLNIGGSNSSGAFTQAIVAAANISNVNNDTLEALSNWNPYTNQWFYVASTYALSDTVVAAERDIITHLHNQSTINAVAGMLATDAYHAGQLRGNLFQNRGLLLAQPVVNNSTVNITLGNVVTNLTSWINNNAGTGQYQNNIYDNNGNANIVYTDSNGLLVGRAFGQVRSILTGGFNFTQGLFYPNGFRGNFSTVQL